ncbi:phosphatase, partial [Actinacidiphila rubida]
AEGRVAVAVPVDDSVRADEYRPLTRYVLSRAWLTE